MAKRYGLGDVDHLTALGEMMSVEDRAEFLVIFERLAFLEAMSAKGRPEVGT